jgi:ParB family chromosome partitioning protein
MPEPARLIPDLPVDQITATGVFRADLGDIDELADSITRLGLLTPVTVTDDLLLVSGTRRLAAIRRLGWATVPAWITPQVSDRLTRVLAMRDTDALHKQLTPIEQAELYAELEQLYTDETRHRTHSTHPGDPTQDKPSQVWPCSPREIRVEAARAVTGTDSHQRLEQINELRRIAADKTENPMVRQSAADALMALNEDGVVGPRWEQVKLHQAAAAIERAALDPREPEQVQQAALDAAVTVDAQPTDKDKLREARHAVNDITQARRAAAKAAPPPDPDAPPKRAIRQLVDLLRREHGWWDRHDPAVFARLADEEQWELVASYIERADDWLARAENTRP